MNLLPGVRSQRAKTSRLDTHYLESGPDDGIPVVFIHGNLATARFFEHLFPGAPDRYRFIAPDMRSFGDSERKVLDATRGLRDWADDTHALITHLGIDRPVHLVGWSTGGSAIATWALDRPVASLTLIDPASPYGFGGTHLDGTPCAPDWAGTGGGTGNPEFAQRLAAGDRSTDSPLSPRNVMNSSYWNSGFRLDPEREEILLTEMLKSGTGENDYPGDLTTSENWPGIAPGKRGVLNALSGQYGGWAELVDLDPKPPVLWTHGTSDIVVADGSAWEMGTLGKMGLIPGWPGEEAFPPQPMVSQIRNVLNGYRDAGGRVEMEMFEGSGHGPMLDSAERWGSVFFDFLASLE